jgi:hypothetical protein
MQDSRSFSIALPALGGGRLPLAPALRAYAAPSPRGSAPKTPPLSTGGQIFFLK